LGIVQRHLAGADSTIKIMLDTILGVGVVLILEHQVP
jgi:hypothetical protein